MEKKKLVGVKIEEGELGEMVAASHVDAAGTAILALARIGLRVMRSLEAPRMVMPEEVRS